jgi:hypothetical protein
MKMEMAAGMGATGTIHARAVGNDVWNPNSMTRMKLMLRGCAKVAAYFNAPLL